MAIFDCFPFSSELDVVDIRLNELSGVVDYFVLAEAPVTHSGKPKLLYYAENKERFRDFSDRIIHLVVDDMPQGLDPPGSDERARAREAHQRDSIGRFLRDRCGAGDIILLSDADEIPSVQAVRNYQPTDGLMACEQHLSYYWLNCRSRFWSGTRIFSGRFFLESGRTLTQIRYRNCPVITGGGWHFAYLGGAEAIIRKIESFLHIGLDREEYKNPEWIRLCVDSGLDLFGRDEEQYTFVGLDASFPKYVLDNRDRLGHLWRDAAFPDLVMSGNRHLLRLVRLFEKVRHLEGRAIEFGCWDGRSTVALVNVAHPQVVLCVDTWLGSYSENPWHLTVKWAQERDIYSQFCRNLNALTQGNWQAVRQDALAFLVDFVGPVKFAYLDHAHDYPTVYTTIRLLLGLLTPGAIICGDDLMTANAFRDDLWGGVERAVRELLPGFKHYQNLWWWVRPEQ